jgi:hypothetical protein
MFLAHHSSLLKWGGFLKLIIDNLILILYNSIKEDLAGLRQRKANGVVSGSPPTF